MSEPSSATTTIIDYIKMRNLDVICDDTNLVTHQFPITSISWRYNQFGEIMKSQQVNVDYENSLVLNNTVLGVWLKQLSLEVRSHRYSVTCNAAVRSTAADIRGRGHAPAGTRARLSLEATDAV